MLAHLWPRYLQAQWRIWQVSPVLHLRLPNGSSGSGWSMSLPGHMTIKIILWPSNDRMGKASSISQYVHIFIDDFPTSKASFPIYPADFVSPISSGTKDPNPPAEGWENVDPGFIDSRNGWLGGRGSQCWMVKDIMDISFWWSNGLTTSKKTITSCHTKPLNSTK